MTGLSLYDRHEEETMTSVSLFDKKEQGTLTSKSLTSMREEQTMTSMSLGRENEKVMIQLGNTNPSKQGALRDIPKNGCERD